MGKKKSKKGDAFDDLEGLEIEAPPPGPDDIAEEANEGGDDPSKPTDPKSTGDDNNDEDEDESTSNAPIVGKKKGKKGKKGKKQNVGWWADEDEEDVTSSSKKAGNKRGKKSKDPFALSPVDDDDLDDDDFATTTTSKKGGNAFGGGNAFAMIDDLDDDDEDDLDDDAVLVPAPKKNKKNKKKSTASAFAAMSLDDDDDQDPLDDDYDDTTTTTKDSSSKKKSKSSTNVDHDDDYDAPATTGKKSKAKKGKKKKKADDDFDLDALAEEAKKITAAAAATGNTTAAGSGGGKKKKGKKGKKDAGNDDDFLESLVKEIKKEEPKKSADAPAAATTDAAPAPAEGDDAPASTEPPADETPEERKKRLKREKEKARKLRAKQEAAAKGEADAEKKDKKKGKKGAAPSAAIAQLKALQEAKRAAEEEAKRLQEEEEARIAAALKAEKAAAKAAEEAKKKRDAEKAAAIAQAKREGTYRTKNQRKRDDAARARQEAVAKSQGFASVEEMYDAQKRKTEELTPEQKREAKKKREEEKKAAAEARKKAAEEKIAREEAKRAEKAARKAARAAEMASKADSEEESDDGGVDDAEAALAAQVAVIPDTSELDDWEALVDDDVAAEKAKEDAAAAAAKAEAKAKAEAEKAEAAAKLKAARSRAAIEVVAAGKTVVKAAETIDSEDSSSDEEESSDEYDSYDEESSDEESSDESSSEDENEAQARRATIEASRKAREARMEEAKSAATKENLRSPICVVLGHVDTGKTKLLDKIRRTNVQDGEAGGITQQIGATFFPPETISKSTDKVKQDMLPDTLEAGVEIKAGLLVIDTPGHESFTNLRSRGSSLCDIAILVVDVMHGLEQQTIESLNLLKKRKTPFVVALNKIDRLYGWVPCPNEPIVAALAKQPQHVKEEYEQRVKDTMTLFQEQGLNSKLYYENDDFKKYVSLVPTSAITGEGIPDMLFLLVQLTTKLMSSKLMYISELQCTVLEVKVIEGLGTTIDVVLVNGVIHEGDTIVVCGLQGPIVTTVRALLTPQPLKELRVKGSYVHHKEVVAAMGIKIAAQDLEEAVAGTQLLVMKPGDDIEDLKEEVMSDLKNIMTATSDRGVYVMASTLGSLEALLEFLRTSKIPVAGVNIGPVHKRDVTHASIMREKGVPQFACILAFDVVVDKEAKIMANNRGVRIFTADIIYHLFDQFTAYMDELKATAKKDAISDAIFPCQFKIVPECVFNKCNPIIMGVEILDGTLHIGTPISVPNKEGKGKHTRLGRVVGIERDKKSVPTATKGMEVAIRIEGPKSDGVGKVFGRHFFEEDTFVSHITRDSIDTMKEHYREELKKDLKLMKKLKTLLDIN